MAVKPYKIEEEKPQMLAEPMAVYGRNAAYEYDDVDVLDREDEEDLLDAEWDEMMKLGIRVGIEQIKRGNVRSFEDVCKEIRLAIKDEIKKMTD